MSLSSKKRSEAREYYFQAAKEGDQKWLSKITGLLEKHDPEYLGELRQEVTDIRGDITMSSDRVRTQRYVDNKIANRTILGDAFQYVLDTDGGREFLRRADYVTSPITSTIDTLAAFSGGVQEVGQADDQGVVTDIFEQMAGDAPVVSKIDLREELEAVGAPQFFIDKAQGDVEGLMWVPGVGTAVRSLFKTEAGPITDTVRRFASGIGAYAFLGPAAGIANTAAGTVGEQGDIEDVAAGTLAASAGFTLGKGVGPGVKAALATEGVAAGVDAGSVYLQEPELMQRVTDEGFGSLSDQEKSFLLTQVAFTTFAGSIGAGAGLMSQRAATRGGRSLETPGVAEQVAKMDSVVDNPEFARTEFDEKHKAQIAQIKDKAVSEMEPGSQLIADTVFLGEQGGQRAEEAMRMALVEKRATTGIPDITLTAKEAENAVKRFARGDSRLYEPDKITIGAAWNDLQATRGKDVDARGDVEAKLASEATLGDAAVRYAKLRNLQVGAAVDNALASEINFLGKLPQVVKNRLDGVAESWRARRGKDVVSKSEVPTGYGKGDVGSKNVNSQEFLVDLGVDVLAYSEAKNLREKAIELSRKGSDPYSKDVQELLTSAKALFETALLPYGDTKPAKAVELADRIRVGVVDNQYSPEAMDAAFGISKYGTQKERLDKYGLASRHVDEADVDVAKAEAKLNEAKGNLGAEEYSRDLFKAAYNRSRSLATEHKNAANSKDLQRRKLRASLSDIEADILVAAAEFGDAKEQFNYYKEGMKGLWRAANDEASTMLRKARELSKDDKSSIREAQALRDAAADLRQSAAEAVGKGKEYKEFADDLRAVEERADGDATDLRRIGSKAVGEEVIKQMNDDRAFNTASSDKDPDLSPLARRAAVAGERAPVDDIRTRREAQRKVAGRIEREARKEVAAARNAKIDEMNAKLPDDEQIVRVTPDDVDRADLPKEVLDTLDLYQAADQVIARELAADMDEVTLRQKMVTASKRELKRLEEMQAKREDKDVNLLEDEILELRGQVDRLSETVDNRKEYDAARVRTRDAKKRVEKMQARLDRRQADLEHAREVRARMAGSAAPFEEAGVNMKNATDYERGLAMAKLEVANEVDAKFKAELGDDFRPESVRPSDLISKSSQWIERTAQSLVDTGRVKSYDTAHAIASDVVAANADSMARQALENYGSDPWAKKVATATVDRLSGIENETVPSVAERIKTQADAMAEWGDAALTDDGIMFPGISKDHVLDPRILAVDYTKFEDAAAAFASAINGRTPWILSKASWALDPAGIFANPNSRLAQAVARGVPGAAIVSKAFTQGYNVRSAIKNAGHALLATTVRGIDGRERGFTAAERALINDPKFQTRRYLSGEKSMDEFVADASKRLGMSSEQVVDSPLYKTMVSLRSLTDIAGRHLESLGHEKIENYVPHIVTPEFRTSLRDKVARESVKDGMTLHYVADQLGVDRELVMKMMENNIVSDEDRFAILDAFDERNGEELASMNFIDSPEQRALAEKRANLESFSIADLEGMYIKERQIIANTIDSAIGGQVGTRGNTAAWRSLIEDEVKGSTFEEVALNASASMVKRREMNMPDTIIYRDSDGQIKEMMVLKHDPMELYFDYLDMFSRYAGARAALGPSGTGGNPTRLTVAINSMPGNLSALRNDASVLFRELATGMTHAGADDAIVKPLLDVKVRQTSIKEVVDALSTVGSALLTSGSHLVQAMSLRQIYSDVGSVSGTLRAVFGDVQAEFLRALQEDKKVTMNEGDSFIARVAKEHGEEQAAEAARLLKYQLEGMMAVNSAMMQANLHQLGDAIEIHGHSKAVNRAREAADVINRVSGFGTHSLSVQGINEVMNRVATRGAVQSIDALHYVLKYGDEAERADAMWDLEHNFGISDITRFKETGPTREDMIVAAQRARNRANASDVNAMTRPYAMRSWMIRRIMPLQTVAMILGSNAQIQIAKLIDRDASLRESLLLRRGRGAKATAHTIKIGAAMLAAGMYRSFVEMMLDNTQPTESEEANMAMNAMQELGVMGDAVQTGAYAWKLGEGKYAPLNSVADVFGGDYATVIAPGNALANTVIAGSLYLRGDGDDGWKHLEAAAKSIPFARRFMQLGSGRSYEDRVESTIERTSSADFVAGMASLMQALNTIDPVEARTERKASPEL